MLMSKNVNNDVTKDLPIGATGTKKQKTGAHFENSLYAFHQSEKR